MNGLSGFITAFCSVCVLMGGVMMLSPKGALEKPVKYVFALIFLCCILSSVLSITKSKIKFDIKNGESTLSENTVKAEAELIFSDALEKNNIEFSKITVCTDKLKDNSIIISKVIVYSTHSPDDIYGIIGNNDTFEVIVINGE